MFGEWRNKLKLNLIHLNSLQFHLNHNKNQLKLRKSVIQCYKMPRCRASGGHDLLVLAAWISNYTSLTVVIRDKNLLQNQFTEHPMYFFWDIACILWIRVDGENLEGFVGAQVKTKLYMYGVNSVLRLCMILTNSSWPSKSFYWSLLVHVWNR